MREILDRVEEWRERGERVAVATVLATAGSTPRPAGAKMAMTAYGDVAGSISGGCVDTDVIEHAMEVLRSGRPQIVEYGYSPDMTWEVGLMCGGSVQVFIEPAAGGRARGRRHGGAAAGARRGQDARLSGWRRRGQPRRPGAERARARRRHGVAAQRRHRAPYLPIRRDRRE